jgi:hypothetical protein
MWQKLADVNRRYRLSSRHRAEQRSSLRVGDNATTESCGRLLAVCRRFACETTMHPDQELVWFARYSWTLHPFEELNKHTIGVGSEDRSNRSDGLRFPGQKRYTTLPQSRRCPVKVRYTKREVIDTDMIR